MAFEQSFESVLREAKLGSTGAWAEIYREIVGPVTGFFRARGVSEPEDTAHDVFFELSRNIDRFDGDEKSFRTLVFVIAHRRMIEDRHSARASRSRLADRVLDRIKRDAGVNEQPTDDEVTEEVRKAFQILTQEQRDVLTLRVVGGLSVEQTAEVVERGVGTVKYLQRKALAKVGGIVPGEAAT